jgi:molybdopterin synthase sulfur carrier subunit
MKVLYFAWLRDRVGTGEETVDPPPDVCTVGDLMAWLAARSETHARAFSDPAIVRCAVDQNFADVNAPLDGAAEVAFFPPVTGG